MNVTRVLVVDDEELNLEILAGYFSDDVSFSVRVINSGEGAWALLQAPDTEVDVILLDRKMPGLDGIGLLRRIKSAPQLAGIPVILQTAADSASEIQEGLEAGAYYYLTKPYRPDALFAIVRAAAADGKARNSLHQQLHEHINSLQFMSCGEFVIRTIEDASKLSSFLALACPNADKAVLGIAELLINAVEHGNLGLTYAEKSRFKRDDTWQAEIERRQALPENHNKRVKVSFERKAGCIILRVADQGNGFAWQEFLGLSPERACDPNGRGIALAGLISFSGITYEGSGNIAIATIPLDQVTESSLQQ